MKKMLDEEFLEHAPSHTGTVRGNHESSECSGGRDSMIVERTDDYIRAYCFRCGARGYHVLTRHYKPPSDKTADAGVRVSPTSGGFGERKPASHPPHDATTEGSAWPREPREWIRRGGLTTTQAEDLGIQWSDSKASLWLPVKQDKVVVGWVVRRFNPKFVRHETISPEKFWGYLPAEGRTLVLVEDWVSAIRVSKFTPVIAMMGTELKSDCLRWLAENSSKFDEVVVFLDADNTTVRMKARRIARKISFLRTRTIETGGDPKHLSDEELEEIL